MPLQYLWVSLPMRIYMFKRYNVSIHRARTVTLNIETRPRKGSECNALLSEVWPETSHVG